MIAEPDELKYVRRKEGQVVGVTSGCFDLFHAYHLQYLIRCKAQCDVLIVGVDSDDMIIRNKGKEPGCPEFHRAQVLAALRCVDVVYVQRSLNDLKTACREADKLFKNDLTIYGEKVIGPDQGAELVIVPDVEEVTSTTQLKAKITRQAVVNEAEFMKS